MQLGELKKNMEPKLTITLPFVGKSPNVKEHWSIRAKFAKDCKWYIRSQAPRLLLPKARIQFTRVGRKMDQDNLAASFKAIQDALKGWVIVEDSPDEIEAIYHQRRLQRGEKPHITIEVF